MYNISDIVTLDGTVSLLTLLFIIVVAIPVLWPRPVLPILEATVKNTVRAVKAIHKFANKVSY